MYVIRLGEHTGVQAKALRTHTPGGEFVDIGRVHLAAAVGASGPCSVVISHEHHDAWAFLITGLRFYEGRSSSPAKIFLFVSCMGLSRSDYMSAPPYRWRFRVHTRVFASTTKQEIRPLSGRLVNPGSKIAAGGAGGFECCQFFDQRLSRGRTADYLEVPLLDQDL